MRPPWHGPADGEGPAPSFGPVDRVAVLADVHANVLALEAVLSDVEEAGVDLVVFCGDLTWGPEPTRTTEIARSLGGRAVFVRGNADRAAVGLARKGYPAQRPRDRWMVGQHSPAAIEFLEGFAFTVVVEVRGLGSVRFCHGSPRSDTELITPGTPADRLADIAGLIPERILVTGHSHLQFDREADVDHGDTRDILDSAFARIPMINVSGLRSINPGSVGLPYHDGQPGTAHWALLGPDVRLRATRYDVRAAVARCVRSGDPGGEKMASLLLSPPSVAEIIQDAEERIFAD
jgi:predicted phosphodiesterase